MKNIQKTKTQLLTELQSLRRKLRKTRTRNTQPRPRRRNTHPSEPALKESDVLCETLLNALPDAILLTDCDGTISYASQRALEIFAYSRNSDLVGTSILDLIPVQDRPKIMAIVTTALAGYPTYDSHMKVRRKNGTFFIGEFNAAPTQDADGTPKRIIVIARDITERERNQLAVRESEEKFRTLAEKLPNMVFINIKGRVVYTNEKSIEVLGYTRDEFYAPDFNFLSLTAPEHHSSEKNNFKRHLEGKDIPPHEYTLLTKDGNRIDALIVTTLIKYEGENAILGIVTDITERKRTEEILRESERRFKEIIDTVHLVSVVLDRNGTITFCNDFLLKTTGYTRQDVIGRNWFDTFLPADETEKVKNAFFELMPAGKLPHYFENSILTRDGVRRMIRWNNTALKDHSGLIIGSASIGEDVTERTQAEEAVRLAQKMESLGVLAGGIAHDFNNLLHAILGQHHLALRKLPPGNPARENVEKAQKAADRASDLTRKLLAYSGRGNYDIKPVDLTAFVLETIHLLEVAIPKNVVLNLERARSRLIIDADTAQLQQIVMNLVINAAESMEEKTGLIRISTYGEFLGDADLVKWTHADEGITAGNYVILEVNDNGSGMSREIMEKIYDPFFTTKFAGRGLGLAAVLGIVRGHHGGMQVVSSPGHGTTFRVAFPASSANLPRRTATEHSLRSIAGLGKMLIIDDESGVREVFRSVLMDYGVDVITAENGEEGIRIFRKERDTIILVVLDLSMPGMGGEETFRQLKTIAPQAKIVLSSGYDEVDATKRFEGLGLTGFIQKPYDWDRIEEMLMHFLK